jgi:hypothetical protein
VRIAIISSLLGAFIGVAITWTLMALWHPLTEAWPDNPLSDFNPPYDMPLKVASAEIYFLRRILSPHPDPDSYIRVEAFDDVNKDGKKGEGEKVYCLKVFVPFTIEQADTERALTTFGAVMRESKSIILSEEKSRNFGGPMTFKATQREICKEVRHDWLFVNDGS